VRSVQINPPMTSLDWTLLSEVPLHLGWRRITRRTYRYPDGREADYEIKDEPQIVTILCLTSAQQVVLVRQFRPGPGEILMEMPGGVVDPGEEPAAAAARELLEETGYAGEVHAVGTVLCDAYSTMLRHVYAVTGARRVSGLNLDANEFIEPLELPLAEFRSHLRRGRLTDVEAGYLALDALNLL
jgi:ADP-ribose pyrophosphatase